MKREIPISKILAIALLALGINTASHVRAEARDLTFNSEESSLLRPIQDLANAIMELVNVISPGDKEPEHQIGLETYYTIANESPCSRQEIQKMQNSGKQKIDSEWELSLAIIYDNVARESWLDINGDGMIDYVYRLSSITPNISGRSYIDENGNSFQRASTGDFCVALGTGDGWEYVYRCSKTYEDDGDPATSYTYNLKYYGDCADMTP